MSHTDFDKCTCLGLCHVGGEETKPPVEAGRLVEKLPGLALQRPPVRRQLLQGLHRLLDEGAESALQRVHVKPEDECEIEFQNNWGYFFSPYIEVQMFMKSERLEVLLKNVYQYLNHKLVSRFCK